MVFFKSNLILLRKRHSLLQKQVAIEVGLKHRTYQAYEEGRSQPNNACLIKLAHLLNISIQDLVLSDCSKIEPGELKANLSAVRYQMAGVEVRNKIDELLKIGG